MIILSIETSCDETAVSLLQVTGNKTSPSFRILGNVLFSQAKMHEQYGGVFPTLAKREHAKNLPPLLLDALTQAKLIKKTKNIQISPAQAKDLMKTLIREVGAGQNLITLFSYIKKPKINVIAVTQGPGLEPALWVGIKVAQALGDLWNIPVIPINHMEGHILSVLYAKKKTNLTKLTLPAIALLISGGHTELVYTRKFLSYKLLGHTRDDAVGEAYDKVARMLGLPYPGGPEISRLAEKKRKSGYKEVRWNLPRPMIHTKDLDFSFSGLKTAVRYATQDKKLSETQKEEVAKEFEDAVTEVLVSKTKKALIKYKPKTLIIGGGVSANLHIRKEFEKIIREFPKTKLHIPERELSTDNSVMIGIAGYERIVANPKLLKQKKTFRAEGQLHLTS